MKILTAAAIAFGASLAVPALAQNAPVSTQTPPQQQQQTMPSNDTMSHTDSMSTRHKLDVATADLTGQMIYTKKGKRIGTISAMTSGANGARSASVTMDRYLGMGGQKVLIPVSSLTERASGGLTTSLTASELKALPRADNDKMQ